MGRTRKLSPDAWKDYRRKARTLLEAADVCIEYELFDAGAILAIHSAILFADATLIRNAGIRSASDSHEDVVKLLATNIEEAKAPSRQLAMLLDA